MLKRIERITEETYLLIKKIRPNDFDKVMDEFLRIQIDLIKAAIRNAQYDTDNER